LKAASTDTATPRAAIIGSDLLLAALPAEPVQVVNACLALGFDIVVPASWGDELVAVGVLDELALRPPGTAILCSCPRARSRLTSAGDELSPFLVQTVAPPVAAARYLRTLNSGSQLNVTYIGSCPGAVDESIDERLGAQEFLELCARHNVSPESQADVFESTIPTDRRRYVSLPGGAPTKESVARARPGTQVVLVDAGALAFDVAQRVISGRPALLDMSASVGCACSGFGDPAIHDGRQKLLALEPPRSATPVVDGRLSVDIDAPLRAPLPSTAFEESVPLNVVPAADIGYAEAELPSAIRALVHHPVAPEVLESHPVQPSELTPLSPPEHRSPTPSLPRAYRMVRGLRASGEHAALSQGGGHSADGPAQTSSGSQLQHPMEKPVPDVQRSSEPAARAAHAAAEQSPLGHAKTDSPATAQGAVDTVLDILTKAIRDVVERR
jgi:hypothetical protein